MIKNQLVISKNFLIFSVSLFLTIFCNFSFFNGVIKAYGLSGINIVFVASTGIVNLSLLCLIFFLFWGKFWGKFSLIFILIISSFAAYFMDVFGVVIDSDMINNALETDKNESFELLNLKLFIYVFFLGFLPSIFVFWVKIIPENFWQSLKNRVKYVGISFGIILIILISFSKFYASFFRENKPLRFKANPAFWMYSASELISKKFESEKTEFKIIAPDAAIEKSHPDKLVIFVVGEAARSANFSLNGYSRKTNPLLENAGVLSLKNFTSCGTSTAFSLPCMFGIYPRNDYSIAKAHNTQNSLDILAKLGVHILWRDNNSDSKGVAIRTNDKLFYQDFKNPKNNEICNPECRDEGMLKGLEEWVNERTGDKLIVLHQMGNHGPAYFKRYPNEFEKFKPSCKDELQNCTQDEIKNAYDNAILYTDFFLNSVIDFLKKYEHSHETIFFYSSDHGESLGENGIYLHGMPYFFAPDYQKHIGAIFWFGNDKNGEKNTKIVQKKLEKNLSHDNIFHTLLGFFGVKTKIYDKSLDILQP